jgi:hypothetical protein
MWRVEKRTIEDFQFDLLAQRILGGKILASEGFVYDQNESTGGDVFFGKEPASDQGKSERLEIAFTAWFESGFPSFRVRPSGNDGVAPIVLEGGAGEWLQRRK